jgi:hypothetical protein
MSCKTLSPPPPCTGFFSAITIHGDSCHLPTKRNRAFIILARPSATRGAAADWNSVLDRVAAIIKAECHLSGYQSARDALGADNVSQDYYTWTPRNVKAEAAYHMDGPAPTIISSSWRRGASVQEVKLKQADDHHAVGDTVTAQRLSWSDMKRLSTFPDSYGIPMARTHSR